MNVRITSLLSLERADPVKHALEQSGSQMALAKLRQQNLFVNAYKEEAPTRGSGLLHHKSVAALIAANAPASRPPKLKSTTASKLAQTSARYATAR